MGSKEQKQFLLVGVIVGITNVALSLFSLYTLISLGIFFVSLLALIALKAMALKKEGIIKYIPLEYHNILLHRSIFDIICDIWFEPRIIIYVKALVLPFLVKMDPSEAIEQFNDFPPALKEKVLTKGLVNIMPGFVKNVMLPPNENTTADSPSEASSISLEEEELIENREYMVNTLREKKPTRNNDTLSDTRSNKNTARSNSSMSPPKVIDISDEGNDNITTTKRQYTISTNTGSINESSKIVPPKKVELSKTWDKLEDFIRKSREKIIKQRMGLIPPPKTFELKGPLSKLQKLAMSMNSETIISNLDSKRLIGLLIISGLGLMAQLTISKRTRAWTLSLLYVLAYAAGITVSSGSFLLLLIKLKARLSRKALR